jgi:hypothetical protein
VLFKVNATSGKETVLYNFTGGSDGGEPNGGLIEDGEGNLFGTAELGGNLIATPCLGFGCGVVFELQHGVNPRDDEQTADTPADTLPAVTLRRAKPLIASPFQPRLEY